jgi:hypothetical protein
MKKTYATSIVIALASLAAGQAMASTGHIDPTTGVNFTALREAMNTPSSVTREQVKAELLADRTAHKTDFVDATTGVNFTALRTAMNTPSAVTREQVRAELAQARRNPPASAYWQNIMI